MSELLRNSIGLRSRTLDFKAFRAKRFAFLRGGGVDLGALRGFRAPCYGVGICTSPLKESFIGGFRDWGFGFIGPKDFVHRVCSL